MLEMVVIRYGKPLLGPTRRIKNDVLRRVAGFVATAHMVPPDVNRRHGFTRVDSVAGH